MFFLHKVQSLLTEGFAGFMGGAKFISFFAQEMANFEKRNQSTVYLYINMKYKRFLYLS